MNTKSSTDSFSMRTKKVKIEDRELTEKEIREAVGNRIREMRDKLNLSAARLAKELGISREAITHIETGRNNISAVSLWKLAVLFKCDPNDFFPTRPDGYALTKVDLHKIAQEDEQAAKWAEKLFGSKK